MSDWRPAKCLLTLRNQVDALYPGRDKSSDGMIGDEKHQATRSEHNPDPDGVVRAFDITHDPAHGLDARKLAEALLASRDPRIMYVISNAQIASATVNPWQWRPYNGINAHRHHMHLSVGKPLADDPRPWNLGARGAPAAVAPAKAPTSIRSNNPGALNAAPWVREYPGFTHEEVTSHSGSSANNTAFFDTPEHGVAAWWELMHRYATAGATTVRQIITKYGGGQDYSEYLRFVEKRTALTGASTVDLDNDATLIPFAKAMWRYEAGIETPIPEHVIRAGFAFARGRHPELAPLTFPNKPTGPVQPATFDDTAIAPAPAATWGLWAKISGFFGSGLGAMLYDWRVVSLILFAIAVFVALFVPREHIKKLVGSSIDRMVGGKS